MTMTEPAAAGPSRAGRAGGAFRKLVATRRDRWVVGIGVAVVLVLAAGGVLLALAGSPGKQITAYFPETIGVYPGSTVRVLGVTVGTVDTVRPAGTRVTVTMTVNAGVAVPADVRAVVVAPSVVADRYIQLTPAYTGGPQISGQAVIPESRTAVPLEVDQLYASLNKLSAALGPQGANKHGALSNAIKTGAANLTGSGADLNAMIRQFSGLSRTLGNSSGNLFATIAYLQQFTTTLKNNNGQVQQAEQQLSQVSAFLAGDRQNLTGAISELATALGSVQGFIASNRGLIKSNVSKLAGVTSLLVRERASLAEALNDAPLAVDNLINAYNGTSHTLTTRGDLNELSMGRGAAGLSAAEQQNGSGAQSPAGAVPVPPSRLGKVPPLPLPTLGTVYGTPDALLAGGRR